MQAKKWMTGLLIGTTLMGSGLATGLVVATTQPMTSQAAKKKAKTKKVTVPHVWRKDGKWHSISTTVKYGQTKRITLPKFKGYLSVNGYGVSSSSIGVTVYKDGTVFYGFTPWIYYKKTTAAQQAKNAKSKKAITATTNYSYYDGKTTTDGLYVYKHESKVKLQARGLKGTWVKIKVPKVKGFTANRSTMHVGIDGKKSLYYFTEGPTYTKNTAFAYKTTKLAVSQSKKTRNLKVTGKFAINNKKNAKKHPAKYAIITDAQGTRHAKLTKKLTLSTTLAKRKHAKTVTVTPAYRTAKKSHGKTTYTYHALAAKKSVAVKATR